jgi:hypothetical protein
MTEKSETLSVDELKTFFTEFLEVYKKEVEANFFKYQDRLALFNSMPVKVELLLDENMLYAIAILSKTKKAATEFHVDKSFQDPMMVIAMSNTKKYEYGEAKMFLYLFQMNAKRFKSWKVDNFVKDFINYELAKPIIK